MSEPIDYDALDPGIRDVVRAINEWGWETCDSGDGVSKPADYECALRFPHVFAEAQFVESMIAEAIELAHLLTVRFGPGWYVEANYSTKDSKAILCAQKDVPAEDARG